MLALSKEVDKIWSLCNVKPDEKVVMLRPSVYEYPDLVDEFMSGLCRIGADYVLVTLPSKKTLIQEGFGAGKFSSLDIQILKGADMILSFFTWPSPVPYFTPPYVEGLNEILESGTRWLDYMQPNPGINLRRLMPSAAMIERTMAGVRLMEKADTIRVVSEAGTDLTLSRKGRKGSKETGVVTHPGEWDNWGFGIVATSPIEESTEGTLVIDTFDYILGLGYKAATEPVKLTFKDGSCEGRIEGGITAKMLENSLEKANDPRAYLVSHIGWGTHEGAVWHDNALFTMADAESYMGNMQIALGKNTARAPYRHSGLGGKNDVNYHCDIELLNCDFYLDDEQILEKGKIVHPECM